MKQINKVEVSEVNFNINNEMVFNKDVTDMDITVYACMKSFVGFNMCAVSSISVVYNMLSFNNKTLQKEIKESLIHLADLDYIGIYDMNYNEIDINTLKPNDYFVVYFGHDGVYNEANDRWQEYFPVTQNDFSIILEKSKSEKKKCKFIHFALCIERVSNYVKDSISNDLAFITTSKLKGIVANANTMTTYLDLLSDIFYYTNSFVDEKGKNCSTYVARKDTVEYIHDDENNKIIKVLKYKSFDDFNNFVYINIEGKGYRPINKEEDSKRKKEGIKKAKSKKEEEKKTKEEDKCKNVEKLDILTNDIVVEEIEDDDVVEEIEDDDEIDLNTYVFPWEK